MTDADAIKVLKFLAKHHLADSMFIYVDNDELVVAENCNDMFFWACADMEEVTAENLPVFEQAIMDCKEADAVSGYVYAGVLFACRLRSMRPQTACYSHYPKWLWPLLDACGPERRADLGNPHTRERAEQDWERKAPPIWKDKK